MFAFLGHLQRTTVDSQADVNRLSRGMTIRRAKKRKYIINDTRIKTCLRRFDDNNNNNESISTAQNKKILRCAEKSSDAPKYTTSAH